MLSFLSLVYWSSLSRQDEMKSQGCFVMVWMRVAHRLIYLNSLFTVDESVYEGLEVVPSWKRFVTGGGIWGFRALSHYQLVYSLYLLFANTDKESSQLLLYWHASLSAKRLSVMIMNPNPLKLYVPNKLFYKLSWSLCFFKVKESKGCTLNHWLWEFVI